MKKILAIPFLLFFINSIYGQKATYDISSNNIHIGSLTVTKIVKGNITQIEIESNSEIKLFIPVDFNYKLNSIYQNEELIFSSVTTYVNDKIHSTTTTNKDKEFYTIVKDGHSSKYIGNITYSGALLYFEEPKNKQIIYSEFDGIEKPISTMKKENYEIKNPENGQLSKYKYEDGYLKKITVQHKILTFTLTKKN